MFLLFVLAFERPCRLFGRVNFLPKEVLVVPYDVLVCLLVHVQLQLIQEIAKIVSEKQVKLRLVREAGILAILLS